MISKEDGSSWAVGGLDKFEEFFPVSAGGLLPGDGAEENGQVFDELFVLQDVVGDAAGIDGRIIEEFEPIFGALPMPGISLDVRCWERNS